MIRFISILVSIPTIVVIAAFAYRNADLVNVDLFIADYNIPLAAVMLVCMFLGGLIGFVVNLIVIVMQKNKIRQLIKQRQVLSGLSDVLKSDK